MTGFIYSYKVLPWVPRWPPTANIFMRQLESKYYQHYPPPPCRLWKRYIDDNFLVWTDSEESLQQSLQLGEVSLTLYQP